MLAILDGYFLLQCSNECYKNKYAVISWGLSWVIIKFQINVVYVITRYDHFVSMELILCNIILHTERQWRVKGITVILSTQNAPFILVTGVFVVNNFETSDIIILGLILKHFFSYGVILH